MSRPEKRAVSFVMVTYRVCMGYHLPSAREIRDNNSGYNGSTIIIYMGGWSNTNRAVDVGLQHSTKYNDWAPFMLIEGVKNPYTF